MTLRAAAQDQLGSTIKACTRDYFSDNNITNATKTDLKAAKEVCQEGARNAFKDAGGDPDEFEVTLRAAAKDEVGESLRACVKDYLSEYNITNAVPQEVRSARMFCQQAALQVCLDLGGDPGEFDEMRRSVC